MLGPKPDAEHGAKPRYTPGPWTVTGGGVLIYSRPAKQEVGYAREVYMCRAEREANARLMAAAPDLLAAAKEALTALQAHCDDCERRRGRCFADDCAICAAMVRLRAAITKAEEGRR